MKLSNSLRETPDGIFDFLIRVVFGWREGGGGVDKDLEKRADS